MMRRIWGTRDRIPSSRSSLMPAWFIVIMALLNAGAGASLLRQGNRPWALIYLGACIIQIGSLWAIRRDP